MAGQIGTALEKVLDQFYKSETEKSQTLIWTVGISASMLALSVAQPARMKAALGNALPTFSMLLLTSIVAAAAWRLLATWLWQRVSWAMLGLNFLLHWLCN